MKTLLIGLIAMVAVATGIFVAGVNGYGPIAYISYHVQVSNSTSQIIPAYINLGNITPGEKGNITSNATIILSSNGTYVIQLLHVEKLSKVFSEFNITIEIGNKTLLLNLYQTKVNVNLTAGKYIVYIKIFYQVLNHPKGDLNVMKEPLLIIHPKGNE
ncbi:hypothetical protein [Sulfurisphaera ohwakuensis]|uniref:2,5-dioxopentanoate dehydrogenase n=1 Tax=Sulfurisphaera ohwakuensis TaxID=69656 RepID=A0A650CJA1_SULOH|nr:hypothetical protein [Sulfurisphaera ohwakuensis]MBB5253867.1 2,5-dioxopentanoate dehydrogenase [Sulfurisphaera ohwakuensis]QGR17934.1 hypothetical protein D1869_12655 [Sulfurisphaera ohwakuensis]